ncbi:MAG: DNA-processing protein DprA [Flavobacteriaceae bacterium]
MPSDPFERTNFLQCNRIIAGLAHATVVIESGKRGGSMITAGYAHQYNREVFALPGPMDAEKSQGCLHLIEQQLAQVIGRPETIAHSLGWKTTAEKQSIKSPPALREDQKTVYTYVAQHPQVSLDALALGLKQSVSQTAALLMELELLDCVQSLPGKRYRVC